ncbi:MAG TPA: hypothetical protein VI248_27575 [Kineosporiaceae bacterium]
MTSGRRAGRRHRAVLGVHRRHASQGLDGEGEAAAEPVEGDKLLFVFDGGTLARADVEGLTLDPGEIAEARFHPPSAKALAIRAIASMSA